MLPERLNTWTPDYELTAMISLNLKPASSASSYISIVIIPPGDIPQDGFKNFFDCVQAYRAAIDAHANLVESE